MSSNEPVKNGCEVIFKMFHILNCGFEIKSAIIIAVMNAIYFVKYLLFTLCQVLFFSQV